jgi:tetratricopeptide (TPR) repeat protein
VGAQLVVLLACLHRAPEPAAAEPAPERISHVARSHYLSARMHLERGQLEEAARDYKRAILFDDDDPQLYLELGALRLLQGDAEAALEWFEEAVTLGGGPEAGVARAMALFELGRLAEAEQARSELEPGPARAALTLTLGHPREALTEADPQDIALLAEAAERGGLCGPALSRAAPVSLEQLDRGAELARGCGDLVREGAWLALLQAGGLDVDERVAANGCQQKALAEEDPGQAAGLLATCTSTSDPRVFRLLLAAGQAEPSTPMEHAEVACMAEDWDSVDSLADESARGLALRGRAALGRGELERAENLLNRSLEMSPADTEVVAWAARARYQRAALEL